MFTIFFGTSNKGKQKEVNSLAQRFGSDVSLVFPNDTNSLKIEESGKTLEENAEIKARAYSQEMNDASIIFVGDDSGIKISALNDEPGVFTRRWAGYEMTDSEILDLCMQKMKDLKGDDRKAVFETVLVALKQDEPPQIYRGQMWGRILEQPMDVEPIEGFPFRSVFWVDEIDQPLYKLHDLRPEARGDFLTHREKAFKQLFESKKGPH